MTMDRYSGRVALVTGASSGIGAATAHALLRHGLTVVGLDLHPEKMQAWNLNDFKGKLHAIHGNVGDEKSILSAFKWITDNVGGVDILINSAGVFVDSGLVDAPTEDWKRTLDVNVLGLSICTREAVQGMLQRGVDDGFIIHICSLAAHIPSNPIHAMYFASKTAISVLLEGLRKDLVARKSKIRVGEVSPALVNTALYKNLSKETRDMWESACLEPEDVAGAVMYMLSQNPRVQVHEVIIRATGSA